MTRLHSWALIPLLGLATMAGCSSKDDASHAPEGDPSKLALEEGCQPLLGGYDCQLPYPSDFFRIADTSSPYGHRLEARGSGRLLSKDGYLATIDESMPFDGASRIPTILGMLPAELSTEGFPGLLEPAEKSLQVESVTLLVDTETGALVPHYSDLDIRQPDAERRAIAIHPLVALSPKTRYVVAIHRAKKEDGTLAPAAEGFRRLRDGITGDPELAELSGRWEVDILAPLEKLGVKRADLQLAWDFTTSSGEVAKADMLRVRELTLAWLEENTPEVTIESVKDNESGSVWREIHGKVQGPLFLVAREAGSKLARDAEGAVIENGMTSFPFTIQVPFSIRDGEEAGHALAYAHGFFGSQEEVEGGSARKIADKTRSVTFGIDWWGMCKEDLGSVVGNITGEPKESAAFADRVHQAMGNWMVMTSAIKRVFPTLPELQREGEGGEAGAPLYDASEVFLFGASQGHILGGTLAALDPNLSRIVLNVGGAGLSHMMFRSRPFMPFLGFIGMSFEDKLDQQKVAAMLQVPLDRIDPATYARLVIEEPLPGSHPERRVLLQTGLGDVQVPNLSSFLHARLLGIGQLTPTDYEVFGLPQVSPPQTSALSVFDFGIDLEEAYARPSPSSKENVVHNDLRVAGPAIEQMIHFFEDGTIIHPCDGPCVLQ